MPIITLPDGNNLTFPDKVTGLDVAEKISKSLAKQAMVISVDGDLKDLDFLIEKDCSIKIFTSKNPEGLETIRHDTAHILAMAVQELFPGTQVTIGPVIENGFYYDFARKEPFTEDDLKKLFPKNSWNKLHLQIIFYGRAYSPARSPKKEIDFITDKIGTKKALKELK